MFLCGNLPLSGVSLLRYANNCGPSYREGGLGGWLLILPEIAVSSVSELSATQNLIKNVGTVTEVASG